MKTTLGLPPEIWALRLRLAEEMHWEPLHAYAAMGGAWNTAAIEMHDATATEDQLVRWAGVPKKDAARFVQALLKIEFVTRLEDGRFEIMLVAKAFGITKARRMGAQITNEKRWATRSNVAPPVAERIAERSTSDSLSDTVSDALSDARSEALSWGAKGGNSVLPSQPQENKSNSELSEQSGSSESPASLSVGTEISRDIPARARSKPWATTRREVARIARNAVAELAPWLIGALVIDDRGLTPPDPRIDPYLSAQERMERGMAYSVGLQERVSAELTPVTRALLDASVLSFKRLRDQWARQLSTGVFETVLRKDLEKDFIAAIETGRVKLPDVPDPPIPAKTSRNSDLNPLDGSVNR